MTEPIDQEKTLSPSAIKSLGDLLFDLATQATGQSLPTRSRRIYKSERGDLSYIWEERLQLDVFLEEVFRMISNPSDFSLFQSINGILEIIPALRDRIWQIRTRRESDEFQEVSSIFSMVLAPALIRALIIAGNHPLDRSHVSEALAELKMCLAFPLQQRRLRLYLHGIQLDAGKVDLGDDLRLVSVTPEERERETYPLRDWLYEPIGKILLPRALGLPSLEDWWDNPGPQPVTLVESTFDVDIAEKDAESFENNPTDWYKTLKRQQEPYEQALARASSVVHALRLGANAPITVAAEMVQQPVAFWEPVLWRPIDLRLTLRPSPIRFSDHLTSEKLCDLWQRFNSVRDSNIRLALRRWDRAWERETTEDQIVDAVIGLESLLSGGNNPELSLRLRQRLAIMLGKTSEERHKIFDDWKEVYKWRSNVVHGNKNIEKLSPDEQRELSETTRQARTWLRQLLLLFLYSQVQLNGETLAPKDMNRLDPVVACGDFSTPSPIVLIPKAESNSKSESPIDQSS